ncbi:hypothetical protein [Chelatococcus reniformis]|uniref:Uncharacterized protein n=1 Tax=Chelatococcus reniformis TaxID=1494448 RepID=A0A916XRH4_9HYPH|nr:hypothetical protein [Chelatococcus reniformis]GGC92427.1 hypothetical protein GCM10010994_57820 [Chelatococcus reniformis]
MLMCSRASQGGAARVLEVAGAAREMPLAAMAEGSHGLALRAWRGRSGKRYVVSVYPLDDADSDYAGALLLAVSRDADGSRRLMEARESSDLAFTGYNGRWLAAMRNRGANELHVHLLAANHEARRRTMVDLGS